MVPMKIRVLPEHLAVARLPPDSDLPEWAMAGSLRFFAFTPDELSIVVREEAVPSDVKQERGLVALAVAGPLDFTEVGIIDRIATALAAAGIPILAQSTFDTDYILVRAEDLDTAVAALRADDITVVG
jgi:uncharacterized protein